MVWLSTPGKMHTLLGFTPPPLLPPLILLRLLQERKAGPLQRGGTLQGAAAAGKDASDKFKSMAQGTAATSGPMLQMVDGRFEDFRWKSGRWDLSLFMWVCGVCVCVGCGVVGGVAGKEDSQISC